MLLAYGADPSSTRALMEATNASNYRLAVLLVTHTKHAIARDLLTSCLVAILSRTTSEELRWVKLFLYAGADASIPLVALRLQQAVVAQDEVLVRLLSGHGAQIVHRDYNALKTAIEACNKRMMELLLQSKYYEPASIGDLLPQVQTSFPDQARLPAMQMLVEAGASGKGVHQALIEVVGTIIRQHGNTHPPLHDMGCLDTLFRAKASVDWQEGAVLVRALRADNIHLFARLLSTRPNQLTRANALMALYIPNAKPLTSGKTDMGRRLLSHSIDDASLCKTLDSAVEHDPGNVDIIRALLEQRLAQSFHDTLLIAKALRNCSTEVFGLILDAMGNKSSLLGKVLLSSLSDCGKAKLLLAKGCPQQDRDAALATEAVRRPVRYDVIRLLLSFGTSADYDDGAGTVVLKACLNHDIELLELVLGAKPSPATIGRALCEVVRTQSSETHGITSVLLTAGPTKDAIDAALVRVVQRIAQFEFPTETPADKHDQAVIQSLTALLLSFGADVNSMDGHALKLAAARRQLDLLRLLLANPKPTAHTLGLVVGHVGLAIEDHEARYQVFQILLTTAASPAATLNEALVNAASERCQYASLWELLLEHASVDHRDGAAILQTIRLQNLAFLPIQLAKHPSRIVMDRAVLEALEMEPLEVRSATVKLLLEHGTSSASRDVIVGRAVKNRDAGLLRLILSHHQQPSTALLDKALVDVVHDTVKTNLCQEYIDKLLDHAANVNALHGQSVQIAARQGNGKLFEQLVCAGASSQTVTRALPLLLVSGMDEEELVALMRMCFGRTGHAPSVGVDSNSESNEPMVYLSLLSYPNGRLILQFVLEHHYDVQWTRRRTLDQQTGEEEVNALIWAHSSEDQRPLSSGVVELLVKHVHVDFAARSSNITALMLAASNGLVELVNILLRHNAAVDIKSRNGRSALSYASENGAVEVVQRLCSQGSRINDGSIHEAARELHPEVVESLLQAGHDPDYPSDVHEGRSAVLEMLLKAQAHTQHHALRLDKTLAALQKAGADTKIEFEGKTALFCALSSEQAFAVTSAFLSTDEWKTVNADHNLYKDATGCYSATILEGEQPEGVEGVPDDLAQQQRKRDAIRDQHRLQSALRRQSHLQDLEEQQHRHTTTIQHTRELDEEKLRGNDNRHSQAMRHNKQLALDRHAVSRYENKAILDHQQAIILQRQGENEHKLGLERQLLREQEQASDRMSSRKMQEIERADESLKLQNRLMLSQVEAQRSLLAAQSYTPRLQLEEGTRSDEPD
ncbi:hypothetical protein LTR85_001850 [Meristemomyces frigidus]|nr:hypothetical protein LTR85_001850 [Meristemomyces frigidus]